jgi:osmoprotectant transport system permease protein
MNDLIHLLLSERASLGAATAAHLDLVLEALLLAVAIGVPLGILASRSRPAERVVISLANVLQTIPSLALLGFLLILFHGAIGKPPARAALVIYALLPIIKNTILGLQGIDRGVSEAALGLGMTPWQRLTIVELPLAVPIILGGVRVAAVASVGMATIAAAIGAKGLGSYIFRGLALSDSRLILLGSIPAALLALACDAALGEVEHSLDPKSPPRSPVRTWLAGSAILILLAIAAFGALGDLTSGSDGKTIVIGSKDSAEPILLGHMLGDLIEDRTDLNVDRRLNLGGTLVCYNALRSGGLDAYVEYTGTALTTILKEDPLYDPEAVLGRVRAGVRRDGIDCLDPLGFENTFAMLMRRTQAERLGIRRISDLRAHLGSIRSGFGPEFMNRPDGYPGLIRAYGLNFANRPREMDRNLLYEALAQGSIDLAAGDSTDGRVATLDLVALVDDRHYFPPYQAVPLVREEILRRHPALRAALNGLAGKLDATTMRELNHQIDGLRRDPAEVAREFLGKAGLLKASPPRGASKRTRG